MKSKGNARVTGTEQYYTPLAQARSLTKALGESLLDAHSFSWLEPAAGSGNFVTAMKEFGVKEVISLDKHPEQEDIEKADFLTYETNLKNAVCLTNPPFGRNHALSVPFFNKAALHCDVIAFIVPRSWRKWSIVKRLDSSFHKVLDLDLEVQYVDKEGANLSKSTILKTVFQVWEKQEDPRELDFLGATSARRFEVVAPKDADLALTVFGRGCGRVRTDFERVKNTTRMYLKADKKDIEVLKKLDLGGFYNSVAYVEALSKVEIEFAVEEHYKTGKTVYTQKDIAKSTLAKYTQRFDAAKFESFIALTAKESLCVNV